MTPKRLVLAGLGVAVAVGLVALLLAARGGGSSAPKTAAAAPEKEPKQEPSAEEASPTPRPRPEVEEPPETDEADGGARVYVRDDGKIVRDHRSGNPEPMMTGGVPVPEKMRKVESRVIYEVRRAARPLVYECAEALDAGSFGDDPMIQAEIMISVDSGALSVDQVAVKFRDVDADTDDVAACVSDKVGQVAFTADEQADVSKYWLTMPFKLRR